MKAILRDRLLQPLYRLLGKLVNQPSHEKGDTEMPTGSEEGASSAAAGRYKKQYAPKKPRPPSKRKPRR